MLFSKEVRDRTNIVWLVCGTVTQGQRAETEIKVEQKQSEVASIKAHLSVLKATNSIAKQRNDKAAATLEATLHITTSILPQCMGDSDGSGSGGGCTVNSHPVNIEASDVCMTATSPAAPLRHHGGPSTTAQTGAISHAPMHGGATKATGMLCRCCVYSSAIYSIHHREILVPMGSGIVKVTTGHFNLAVQGLLRNVTTKVSRGLHQSVSPVLKAQHAQQE